MNTTLLGMTVSRTIPDSVLTGLAIGRYALHGGVVRHAVGTPFAGQIVAHLLPAAGSGPAGALISGAGLVANAAMAASPLGIATAALSGVGAILSGVSAGFSIATWLTSRKILTAVRETMVVAELNLTATQAGFAALDQRLVALERTLLTVKDTAVSIRQLLESTQRAELYAALEHLEKFADLSDRQVRIELLTHSATTLSKLRHLYRDQMRAATTIPEALANEEYFLIAGLAQARCYAELHEPTMACNILTDAIREWRTWARPFAQTMVIGKHPQRYLYADYALQAPLPLIAAWLDFAHDTQKGMAWIEELRGQIEPWFYHRALDGEPREVRRSDVPAARDTKRTLETERLIPTLNKLLAREAVLASYEAQYALMAQHKLTPGDLEQLLLEVAPASDLERMLLDVGPTSDVDEWDTFVLLMPSEAMG